MIPVSKETLDKAAENIRANTNRLSDRVRALDADITTLNVDIIVNAANEVMLGGGGVDHAIHAAAGPRLLEACSEVPEVRPGVRCPTGQARITKAFSLPCRYVIHTVGPIWHGGGAKEERLLASCYQESLRLAVAHKGTSIAFPAISAGAYGYPVEKACEVAVREVKAFLETNTTLQDVILVSYNSPLMLECMKRMIGA
jgi:O-acetyl-ADP-ribose deacetylase (regulator of RNase III)